METLLRELHLPFAVDPQLLRLEEADFFAVDQPVPTGGDRFGFRQGERPDLRLAAGFVFEDVERGLRIESAEPFLRGDLPLAAARLGVDGEVGGLHHFDHRDTGADGVRQSAPDDDDLAGFDRDLVHHPQSALVDARQGFAAEHRLVERFVEAAVDVGAGAAGEDDPRFGFAEVGVEVALRIRHGRVDLNRQPDGRVEKFGQHGGIGAVAGEVGFSEQVGGIFLKQVEEADLLPVDPDLAQPVPRRLKFAGVAFDAGGDPVLRIVAVGRIGFAAHPVDAAAAEIEAANPVREELQNCIHGHTFS